MLVGLYVEEHETIANHGKVRRKIIENVPGSRKSRMN